MGRVMWFGALWAVGCGGVREDDFGKDYAKRSCEFEERCAAVDFFSEWDDQAECRDDLEDWFEEVEDEMPPGCDFDVEAARECLGAFRDSCEEAADDDHFEECAEIYDCGGGNIGL